MPVRSTADPPEPIGTARFARFSFSSFSFGFRLKTVLFSFTYLEFVRSFRFFSEQIRQIGSVSERSLDMIFFIF